jgi:hypothetical protein
MSENPTTPLLSRLVFQFSEKGAKKVAAFLHLSSPFPLSLYREGKEGKGATAQKLPFLITIFPFSPQLYDDTRT